VVLAPAMHTEMWEQPAVQANVALLRERGVTVVDPVAGLLAGGDVGVGRMAEPADIVAACDRVLGGTGDLDGLRVLVTAGGTREPIDPVRFIGNRSSGKMGAAIAEAARDRGASVTLIAGAMSVTPPRGVAGETSTRSAACPSVVWGDGSGLSQSVVRAGSDARAENVWVVTKWSESGVSTGLTWAPASTRRRHTSMAL
jgi:phosphopantothenoylcysteine decarboxylase/phosphopantothenate--cysteine ligase